MNLTSIKKVPLSDLVTKVIIAFQDLKGVVFSKSPIKITTATGGIVTEERYMEIEQGIKDACSLIYPYIYLPTSREYKINDNFIVLKTGVKSIGLIALYINGNFQALRDIMPIPPAFDDSYAWKVYVPNKEKASKVIVFAEEECYCDNDNVYLSDKECVLKQAIYEVARGRTLKRQTYDNSPAGTDELSVSEIEMIQFTSIAFDELTKVLNIKKMGRISELMMLPEHLGNKIIKVPEKSTPSNSYISTRS